MLPDHCRGGGLGAAGRVEHVIEQREAGHFASWREADLANFCAKGV